VKTATEVIPSFLHESMTRHAISPLFAMRIFVMRGRPLASAGSGGKCSTFPVFSSVIINQTKRILLLDRHSSRGPRRNINKTRHGGTLFLTAKTDRGLLSPLPSLSAYSLFGRAMRGNQRESKAASFTCWRFLRFCCLRSVRRSPDWISPPLISTSPLPIGKEE
jgi:hypothetical protein